MNNLNSVLLEGRIIEAARMTALGRCQFSMSSTRTEKDPRTGVITTTECPVAVVVDRPRLAESCGAKLPVDARLRVIGLLTSSAYHDRDGVEHYAMIIVAEHVEFQ